MRLVRLHKKLLLVVSFLIIINISNKSESGIWLKNKVLYSQHKEDTDLKEFLKFYDLQLANVDGKDYYKKIFINGYDLLIKNYVYELDKNKRIFLLNKAKENFTTKKESLVKNNHPITSQELTYSALSALYSNLDPHTTWLSPKESKLLKNSIDGEYYGVGIILGAGPKDKYVKALHIIKNGPAYKAGVRDGDDIYKINNIAYTAKQIEEVANTLKSKDKSSVNIEVIRKHKPIKFVIKRGVVHLQTVNFQILDNKYMYINIIAFNQNTTSEFRKVLKNINHNIQGVIIDLRGNPGGLLFTSLAIADMLLDKGLLLSVKGQDPELNTQYYATKGININPRTPLVVLTNNMTASASEIVGAALQQNDRAIVMGQQSFGKGSVQTLYDLHDGSAVKITIQLFYSPNGEALQGVGVMPQILINPEHKNSFYDIREKSYNNVLVVNHSKKNSFPEIAVDENQCLPYGTNKDKVIGCAIKYFQGEFQLKPTIKR